MDALLLVSEHGLLRQGLCRLLREAAPLKTVSEAATVDEALEHVRLTCPDVVLLHVSHPVGDSVRALHLIRETAPETPVVVLLDALDDEVMVVVMQAGAAGCLDKGVDANYLLRSLEDAANGEIALSERFARRFARMFAMSSREGFRQPYADSLTQRELQVLALLSQGLTNREIARSLYVSESTVRAHLRTVTQKLGVHNRVHAVARAVEMGIIPTLLRAGIVIAALALWPALPG